MSGERDTPLPPPVAKLVDDALAAHAKGDRQTGNKMLVEALRAVSFPTTFPDVVYPLPSELTPEQRALAERLARTDVFLPWEWVPSGATARRWLGIDPPGPLETMVEHEGARLPLWRVLCLTQKGPRVPPIVATLPMPLRLDVLAALDTEAWGYRIHGDARGAWALASSLGAEARDWALARLAAAAPKALETFLAHGSLGEQLAFFALVRAGHAIDPAWDLYLPISTEVPVEISAECARALSLDRLEAVAPALLEKTHGAHAIQIGLELLAAHDSPAIARFVWTKSERSFPHHRDAERKRLAAIGEHKPGVGEVVASFSKRAPKKRSLVVSARLAPRSERDLSELQAAQLIEAGKRWDRKELPAARRLSCDENDESALGAVLEHVTLTENGKPAFEGWLYAGDSGTFFTAGTTKVVAQRIQMGIHVEGKKKDPALADALGRIRESKDAARPLADVRAATQAGLAARRAGKTDSTDATLSSTSSRTAAAEKTTPTPETTTPKKTAAKKTTAKKTAAKKTAAKKAAAKKAAAKKTAAKKTAAKKTTAKKTAAKKTTAKKTAAKKTAAKKTTAK
jgi:hypothetical protein